MTVIRSQKFAKERTLSINLQLATNPAPFVKHLPQQVHNALHQPPFHSNFFSGTRPFTCSLDYVILLRSQISRNN